MVLATRVIFPEPLAKAGRGRCHKPCHPKEGSTARGPGFRVESGVHLASSFQVPSEEQKGAGVTLSSGSLL